LVTLTGTNIVQISSGYITLMASSGSAIPATSSGGLLVHLSNGSAGGGSTAVNLVGSAGNAPVTSSDGLRVSQLSTDTLLGTLVTTVGAPITQHLTTAPLWLYSVTIAATAGTAGNAFGVHSATSALSSNNPLVRMTNPTAVYLNQVTYPRGVYFANGLQVTGGVTFGSTAASTAGANFSLEYSL
jgi:hypothetical protein